MSDQISPAPPGGTTSETVQSSISLIHDRGNLSHNSVDLMTSEAEGCVGLCMNKADEVEDLLPLINQTHGWNQKPTTPAPLETRGIVHRRIDSSYSLGACAYLH